MSSLAPSENGRLRIRRLRNELFVSNAHPAPHRLLAQLESVVATDMTTALAQAAQRVLAELRPGLWLVRELSAPFIANAAWAPDAVARAWAAAFSRTLQSKLAAGVSDDVLWFPDRAAFTARFLVDLAKGCAWGRWAYEGFAGLRALPTSAAVRTALIEEGQGWAILAACSDTERATVITALAAEDARRVLDALAKTGVSDGATVNWAILAEGLDAGFGDGVSEIHLALRLCARAAGTSEASARLVSEAIAFARLARTGGGPDGVPSSSEPRVRHTMHGGAFLILPLFEQLALERATCAWPQCQDVAPAAVVRMLLLAQILGGAQAAATFGDPLLRDLAGVGPRCDTGTLRDWAAGISTVALTTFSRALVERGREIGALGGQVFLLARAPLATGCRLVLLDGARGQWVAIGALGRRRSGRVNAWLRRNVAPVTNAPAALLIDEGMTVVAEETRWTSVGGLADIAVASRTDGVSGLAEVATRLPALQDDLDLLELPASWGLPSEFCGVMTVAAQSLLRSFAWRLPGFAHASLRYLHRNFLDVRATLEEESDRRVVRVGRPPLQLVMAMTGMARATYRLPWTDDPRPFALFPMS